MSKRPRSQNHHEFVRIQNFWKKGTHLHIEKGQLEAGAVDSAWHSARWVISEIGGGLVTIHNFWRPDHYLNCESDRLKASVLENNLSSAMWKMHLLDRGAFRIESHLKPGLFWHIEHGSIELGRIQPEWHSARWLFVGEGAAVRKSLRGNDKLEKWLQPLMVPATREQRQIGRDKCLALAMQSGLRLFTDREPAAAAAHVRDKGFAIVEAVLNDSVLAIVQNDYAEAIRRAVSTNPNGNRGYHRYSISGEITWQLGFLLVDQPEVIDVMCHYFRCKRNEVLAESLHGDFSLPGVDQQPMHIDMASAKGGNPEMANILMVYYNMIDHDDLTGPTRFVEGSQKRLSYGRDVKEEKSVLAFAPRGSAIIMDRRTWHGGTRNLSQFARPMLGPHFGGPRSRYTFQRSLRPEHFAQLSPLGQQVCREILKK